MMNTFELLQLAPNPVDKTDSELAQLYRNWYYGPRANGLPLRRRDKQERTAILCSRCRRVLLTRQETT
jgi:hypothetical protein